MELLLEPVNTSLFQNNLFYHTEERLRCEKGSGLVVTPETEPESSQQREGEFIRTSDKENGE